MGRSGSATSQLSSDDSSDGSRRVDARLIGEANNPLDTIRADTAVLRGCYARVRANHEAVRRYRKGGRMYTTNGKLLWRREGAHIC